MLSDEKAQEIFANEHCNISKELAGILARAIEAAVLPEGWVADPDTIPSDIVNSCRSAICREFGNNGTDGYYKRILAKVFAAARVAQASPLDLMECLQDRPVEPSKAVQGKCVVQAEKQEPVNDEPVAWWHYRINGEWDGFSKQNPPEDAYDGGTLTPLYTRPQPDLTAEVERLKVKERDCEAQHGDLVRCNRQLHESIAALKEAAQDAWKANENLHFRQSEALKRIAALEEAAQQARDALQYKLHVVEAVAKLNAVLGNA